MIPKKSLNQKIKEEELDVLGRVEAKSLTNTVRERKREAVKIMSSEQKEQLMDYIFGKTEVNPLKEFN